MFRKWECIGRASLFACGLMLAIATAVISGEGAGPSAVTTCAAVALALIIVGGLVVVDYLSSSSD